MEQLEFFQLQSPCRGICQTDNRGYCMGCMRSREERFGWLQLSPTEQRNVIRLCRQRMIRKIRAERALAAENKSGEQTPPQGELF
ncbi:DUF1289 domain-containing protein [Motilimonas cestriensis]|uniref:DUF1289 domain-containing protein n=1 Tax=Motilimonas cestriensis TaxID=2742685 RepID=A0ABS8W4P0_9GAMM|nr:DUF1289 domain-containing protein [Motilimonas cestriensis]MCE2593924.1 DUF1289 domain-containing protein [Motilimonas cestriensis]